jgi:hypothetical protein
MPFNWIPSRAVSTLPLLSVVLALANWNVRPDAAWAWAAVIVMSSIMVVARHRSHLALRRSSGDAAAVRSFASVTDGVVFGALMMIIPLAVTLAHAYGVVVDPDSGTRTSQVVLGAYLVVMGNALPRNLPTVASMQGDGARIQAIQRIAGWTCVLCGFGYAAAWLALPIDAAGPVSMALVAAAMIVTIVRVVRLRKLRQHTPGLN